MVLSMARRPRSRSNPARKWSSSFPEACRFASILAAVACTADCSRNAAYAAPRGPFESELSTSENPSARAVTAVVPSRITAWSIDLILQARPKNEELAALSRRATIAGSDLTTATMSAISVVGERDSSISRKATVGSVGSWGDDQIFCASIILTVVPAAGGESFLINFNIGYECETTGSCRPAKRRFDLFFWPLWEATPPPRLRRGSTKRSKRLTGLRGPDRRR